MVAFSSLAVAALASYVVAHPGEKHDAHQIRRELVARDIVAQVGARSLASCSSSASAQALRTRSIKRRAEVVKNIRKKRGIQAAARKDKRDLADLQAWEKADHNMTGTYDYSMFTSLEEVFSGSTSCILAPEVTVGPYYVVGEKMRSNVKEAVPSVAVDVWSCNATGVYSGISENGNNADGGWNSTYLRGIQLTDSDGVTSFETIFPGHYTGRTAHTHLLAHTNAKVMPNGTISVWGSPVNHIRQLFWPDDLRAEVEKTYPYNTNTQEIVTNDEDMWSVTQASKAYDPFPQYVYLGDSIEDGLFAWIQIGINNSADYTKDDYYGVAAYLDAEGGHATDFEIGPGGK
ncbi:aromatic compound dioxygenase [Hypoxylon sp. NC1633]|nr:aromatic compound dioxygenase [Hypoxylon sp. NC1633]